MQQNRGMQRLSSTWASCSMLQRIERMPFNGFASPLHKAMQVLLQHCVGWSAWAHDAQLVPPPPGSPHPSHLFLVCCCKKTKATAANDGGRRLHHQFQNCPPSQPLLQSSLPSLNNTNNSIRHSHAAAAARAPPPAPSPPLASLHLTLNKLSNKIRLQQCSSSFHPRAPRQQHPHAGLNSSAETGVRVRASCIICDRSARTLLTWFSRPCS